MSTLTETRIDRFLDNAAHKGGALTGLAEIAANATNSATVTNGVAQ